MVPPWAPPFRNAVPNRPSYARAEPGLRGRCGREPKASNRLLLGSGQVLAEGDEVLFGAGRVA
jgi:hypothetical protein